MSTTRGKRKLPHSYLPFIGNLIDRFPYYKLPTKKVVLQRLTQPWYCKFGIILSHSTEGVVCNMGVCWLQRYPEKCIPYPEADQIPP